MRAIWVMLPGAILWGASFPLALASVATRGQDSARLVGGVYAANTVGAIIGATVVSLALVGTVGSQKTQQILIGVAAMSGLLMLMPATGEVRKPLDLDTRGRDRHRAHRRSAGAFSAADSVAARRLRPLLGDVGGAERDGLCRRRRDRVRRRHAYADRRAQLSQRRQGAGLERAAGHAAAAHARPHYDARAEEPEQGAGDRLRRRSHRRRGLDRSAGEGSDDCRDRAARSARRLHPLRPAQLQRRRQPQGESASRRCAALPADDEREVRRDHVRPARSRG